MGACSVDIGLPMRQPTKNLPLIVCLSLMSLVMSCSGDSTGDGDPNGPDAGSTMAIDAGVRALCPQGMQATCNSAMDCGDLKTAPSNCSGCLPYSKKICRLGQCEEPEALGSGDPINYLFKVGNLQETLQSFAGIVVTAESSGGQAWTCDDVYNQKLDLTSMCHNILDTRGQDIAQPDDQFTVTFTRFASSQTSLFIVYGYSEPGSEGNPIGVSCTEYEVGAPGLGLVMIPGDQMRRLM